MFNFKLDTLEANEILKFKIPDINKNIEINNNLFNKETSKKILTKLKKINQNYMKLIKEDYEKKLDEFLIKKPLSEFDETLIPFMIIQSEKLYKETPRLIQIICLLYYLEGYENNSGLILEVLTGEGKTLIISFFALYMAILGNKVDILTSSPVLAERDSKNRKKFYNRFGVKCDFCRNNSKLILNENNQLECYDTDIIYGDGINLIGDILRSEFMRKKGRGDRDFDYIIIDEIDNICIDNLKNIVELIDNFPGFKYLEYLYLFIYNSLKIKINEFEKEHEKKFYQKFKNIKTKEKLSEEEFKKELKNDFNKELKENIEIIMNKVSKKTRLFLKENKQRNYDAIGKIYLPPNCNDFINTKIEHWTKMAYDAMYNFEINKNYIITKDENLGFDTIKPIDYANTGVTLKHSVWSGLHQFLQIKEGLILTEENINSSFMSYLSFFRKYKIINGITGTLGSKKTQLAINKIYNINLLKMPPFKPRQLIIFDPQVFPDENDYKAKLIEQIVNTCVRDRRVVLVLFEYIYQVNRMEEFIEKNRKKLKLEKTKVISYIRSDEPIKDLEKEMEPNTIILSTNLSGRGTDIKLNQEVKKNGGLHVIITFMPYNERTEKQAQGRAGRCGDRGSSINIFSSKNDFKTLEERRSRYVLNQYKFLINLNAPLLDLNQSFFEEFCTILKDKKNKEKISEEKLSDMKERWSMFVSQNSIDNFMNDDIHPNLSKLIYYIYKAETKNKFEELKKEINSNNYKFNNSFYQMKPSSSDNDYKDAISKSQEFSIGAYYNQGYKYIIQKTKNYQNLVKNNFVILSNICSKFIWQFDQYIHIFYEIHENDKEKNYKGLFVEQCKEKKNLMKVILDNINKNLTKIKSLDKTDDFDAYISVKDINKAGYPISKNVLEYFKDFGIEFLFEIKPKFNKNEILDSSSSAESD